MNMKYLVYLCVLFVTGQAFMFDDPCNVEPNYRGGIPSDPDFTTTVNVPHSCKNGTFRWDYPKGHAIVHFANEHQDSMSVCFRDALGGNIFTIIDKTEGAMEASLQVTYGVSTYTCTATTTARDIVLQVDAPETMYYMGEVEYRLSMS